MLHPEDGGPPSKRLRPDNPVCSHWVCVSVSVLHNIQPQWYFLNLHLYILTWFWFSSLRFINELVNDSKMYPLCSVITNWSNWEDVCGRTIICMLKCVNLQHVFMYVDDKKNLSWLASKSNPFLGPSTLRLGHCSQVLMRIFVWSGVCSCSPKRGYALAVVFLARFSGGRRQLAALYRTIAGYG